MTETLKKTSQKASKAAQIDPVSPQLEKKLRAFRNEQRKSKPKKKLSYKERNAILEQEIAKLYEGQSFDNWLHLFDEIDAYLPNAGNQRTSAQNDIKRWIELEKGNKDNQLIIKQIYAEPIEKIDGRKQNKGIYLPLLKSILLYSLSQETGYTKEFTYTQFWLEMGMRNQFYTNEKIRKALPKYDSEITEEDLEDFFRRTGIKNKNITDYLLDTLQDECLLRHEKHMMIREGHNEPRYATDEEVRTIGSEKKRFMKEWGYETEQEVFLAGKSRALYKKVKESLGFSYYEQFKVYVYEEDVLKDAIIDNITKIKETLNLESIKNELNSKIIECDVQSADKRHMKELVKVEQEYHDYEQSMAIGPYKGNKEKYIEEHGNELIKSDQYSNKFEKMDQYFTSLSPNKYVNLLYQIEQDLKEEKKNKETKDTTVI